VLDKVWAEDKWAHKVHLFWQVGFSSSSVHLAELIMALCLVAQFGFDRCFEHHGFELNLFDPVGFLAIFSFANPILCPGLGYNFD
jgi:hypothetical protein